jgi:hypothetical protein
MMIYIEIDSILNEVSAFKNNYLNILDLLTLDINGISR